jgi:hypothetical protein
MIPPDQSIHSNVPGVPGNPRILIVDDNEAIHDDFKKILNSDTADAEFDG